MTEEGGVVISGRSDAVLNPGGVRIGTAEIYRQASGAFCDRRKRESARCSVGVTFGGTARGRKEGVCGGGRG